MSAAKIAKAVAIALAVLIVVALGAVIWAALNLGKDGDARDLARRDAAQLKSEIALGLPEGCEIDALDLDGSRLAVHVVGPADAAGCNRIIVVDLARGAVIGTVAP